MFRQFLPCALRLCSRCFFCVRFPVLLEVWDCKYYCEGQAASARFARGEELRAALDEGC